MKKKAVKYILKNIHYLSNRLLLDVIGIIDNQKSKSNIETDHKYFEDFEIDIHQELADRLGISRKEAKNINYRKMYE